MTTDKLEFNAGPSYRRKNWIDGKTKSLEDDLPAIYLYIEQECKRWHDLRKEQAIQEAARKQVELEEKERQLRLKKEKQKVEDLYALSEQWKAAQQLREFIRAAELNNASKTLSPTFSQWLQWAKEQANEMDPLNNQRYLSSCFEK